MKIYTASKTKHAKLWRRLRALGHNIISTWIDEAGEGQSPDYADLADRCIQESVEADLTLLYAEPGETLKGALVEAGAALAAGKRVHLVGDCDSISRVFRKHPNWAEFDDIGDALSI